MSEGDRYQDVVFPEYYEDIFTEDDLDFRFRLLRTHIHPKLRVLLTGCLDMVAEVLETDPHTFSRMRRAPKNNEGDAKTMRCALYGLHLAKQSIIRSRQAIVVEGYTDVIACHQAGIENVVATLGTSLTADHAAVLSRLCDTVILVFDGDEAGQKAAVLTDAVAAHG